jgi:3'(2'), 5'-bisphosphate nucleotidase
LAVLASRRHRNRQLETCLAWLAERWGPVVRHNSGSALKFCQLVAGEGDFYPRFSPCCEWDTAAGQAVLEAAGGALLGIDGLPLRYNCRSSLFSPHFYAIADPGHPLWAELLARGGFGASG